MVQFKEQPETSNLKSSCHNLCLVLILIIKAWKSNFTVWSLFFSLSRPVEMSKLVISLADSLHVYMWIYVCACQCIVCIIQCLRDTSWAECKESNLAFSVNVHPVPFSTTNLTWPRCASSPGGISEPVWRSSEALGLLRSPSQPVLLYSSSSRPLSSSCPSSHVMKP